MERKVYKYASIKGEMGMFFTFLLGVVLIFLAAASKGYDISGGALSNTIITLVSLLLGLLIVFTPIIETRGVSGVANASVVSSHRSGFRWVRRWIFGFALILMSLSDFLTSSFYLPGAQEVLSQFVVGSWGSAVFMFFVGIVYILATFERTRYQKVPTY